MSIQRRPSTSRRRGAACRVAALAATALLAAAAPAAAQGTTADPHAAHAGHAGHGSSADSSFAALQERGKVAMGVDQYTSAHAFVALDDGGSIALRSAAGDTAGTRRIREHLRTVAAAFAAGDFTTPAFVHMREVPGAATMAARRAHIRYDVRDVPLGAEVRITTTDVEALVAVHEFLAFQRADHRVSH